MIDDADKVMMIVTMMMMTMMTMMWLIMMWSEKESAIVDSSWQLVQQKHRLCEHKDDEEADENYPCNDDRNIFYFSSFNFQMNWHTTPIHALPCHEGKDFIKPNSNSNNILHCYNQVRVPFLLNASGISKPIFCTIALFPHSISSLSSFFDVPQKPTLCYQSVFRFC